MVEFLYLILAVSIIFLTYTIFQTVGGLIFGSKIEEIGLFFGPKIFNFSIGEINFRVNAIPIGSYVKFTDELSNLHPIRKILIVISGLLSYCVLAVICLGFSEAITQIVSGFSQIFRMLFSPSAVGAVYIGKTLNLVNEKSFLYELGVISSKFLVFNLLPLGTLNGGNLLEYFLELLGFKSEKAFETYKIISLIPALFLVIAIIISFITYFFKN